MNCSQSVQTQDKDMNLCKYILLFVLLAAYTEGTYICYSDHAD